MTDTQVTDTQVNELRFKRFFTWGGVLIALLGLVLMFAGDFYMGLLLVVAGMISWLFAKRRTRRSEL